MKKSGLCSFTYFVIAWVSGSLPALGPRYVSLRGLELAPGPPQWNGKLRLRSTPSPSGPDVFLRYIRSPLRSPA